MELDAKSKFRFETEFLFNRRSKVRRKIIGPVGEGFRFNIFVEEAEIVGPEINGSCTADGDWFTIRPDGIGIIDSRAGSIYRCLSLDFSSLLPELGYFRGYSRVES